MSRDTADSGKAAGFPPAAFCVVPGPRPGHEVEEAGHGLDPATLKHREVRAASHLRRAVDMILAGHEPYPALCVDRGWNLVTANRMVAPMMGLADPDLLEPPVNVLRLSLHPRGLARHTVNLHEWRAHLLERLRREVEFAADPGLAELLTELKAYPIPGGQPPRRASEKYAGVATL